MDDLIVIVDPVTTGQTVVLEQGDTFLVELVTEIGPAGPRGPGGQGGFISADEGNRTTVGSDGGIFTSQLLVDPVAYYILAKS